MSSPNTFKVGGEIKIDEPDSSKNITDTLATDTYRIVSAMSVMRPQWATELW